MRLRIPDRLLARLDRPVPRYTSYPTVPAWQSDYGAGDYIEALEALGGGDEELSLYVHLPFCARKCDYCGCNTAAAGDGRAVDAYIDRLHEEARLVAGVVGGRRRVVQLHWGGGTPNFLDDRQCARVMDICADVFDLDPKGEISIEVDPRLASRERVAALRYMGFNRVSLGVQDFSKEVQRAIGRPQSRKRTLDVYHACRDAGFESVNLDLVYGLPAQTADGFARTLETVMDLAPDRIACFGYAHVPWARPNQKAIDETLLPKPSEKFALFRQAIDAAEAAGYTWIGLDHFARADDELAVACRHRRLHRNFMGYTTRAATSMLALGMSGIGEVSGHFVQNDARLEEWAKAVQAGKLPVVRGHRLSDDDRLRRRVILNLMCNLELPFDLTTASFGAPVDELLADELDQLRPLADEGLVEMLADRVRVTEIGHFFIRNICLVFDAYLEKNPKQFVFSRSV